MTHDNPAASWARLHVFRRLNQGIIMASTILLVSSVIAGSLVLQSQIGAHDIQTAVPKESVQVAQSYLVRGEALSETRAYPAAIAAYSTAIQLKPDFAEAYNDRGSPIT
jgi:tetratricopeptide repeat protein